MLIHGTTQPPATLVRLREVASAHTATSSAPERPAGEQEQTRTSSTAVPTAPPLDANVPTASVTAESWNGTMPAAQLRALFEMHDE